MKEIYFNDVNELYNRVLPALKLKQQIFMKFDHNVGVDNIWLYLAENKWKYSINLTLYDIVNDIMTLDYETIKDFYKEV